MIIPRFCPPSLALLAFSTASALAGVSAPVPAPPPPQASLLSFADGRVVFDVQERLRWEIRENNFDFNDSVRSLTDDNWFLNRFRIGLTIKPAEWLTIYAQAQDAREWLSDRPDIPNQFGAEGDDSFDLRQAYLDFSNYEACPWGLRIGRQALAFGDQRLIGISEWANFTRTFDAIRLTYKQKTWTVDAFASSVVTIERGQYNQSDVFNGTETGRNQVFSGIYFSTTAIGPQITDVYALHLHEEQLVTETNFLTLGVRFKSKPGAFARHPAEPAVEPDGKSTRDHKAAVTPPAAPRPTGLDYDFEGVFQTGEVRDRDLSAFAIHAGLGYTFDHPSLARLGVEYNYASGDRDIFDDDIETFQNLFPSNHPPYGHMDVFAWQNMHDVAATLNFNVAKPVNIRAEYHAFWLADTDDFWYRSPTATVRPITGASLDASNYAGSELDFIVSWKPRKELTVEAGYAHFFAGDYLSDTGSSDDADFAYVQAILTF